MSDQTTPATTETGNAGMSDAITGEQELARQLSVMNWAWTEKDLAEAADNAKADAAARAAGGWQPIETGGGFSMMLRFCSDGESVQQNAEWDYDRKVWKMWNGKPVKYWMPNAFFARVAEMPAPPHG